MIAVTIFMVAFFIAMGGAAALADARFRRLRSPARRGRRRRIAPIPTFDDRRLQPEPVPIPSVEDERVLVAEIEDWLKQPHRL